MSQVKVVRLETHGRDLPLTVHGGRATALLRPEVGCHQRTLIRFDLPSGTATIPLAHPGKEAVYYVLSGQGQVADPDSGQPQPLRPGLFVYLTPGQRYRFEGPLVVVGGPCPTDPALFE